MQNQRDEKQDTDAATTPMMVQFNSIKEQFPDSILFFRMGDFYEMFNEDAVVASKVLGIALTSRNKNAQNKTPMCGVPHHSYKQYLLKLINAGYKVAICDQLEDPALAKGLVKRGVTRVVTPATIIDAEELADAENNFLLAIYLNDAGLYFISAADISTGEIYLSTAKEHNIQEAISTYSPKEILSSTHINIDNDVIITIKQPETASKSAKSVQKHYNVSSYEHLGISSEEECIPLKMILSYVADSMLNIFFARPVVIAEDDRLILDNIASKTLELMESVNEKGKSLFSVLNHTSTPMGARMLKWKVTHPSRKIAEINKSLDIVEYFVKNWNFTEELGKMLSPLYDIERIANRIASKRVSPRELIWLKDSISELPRIGDLLESTGYSEISLLGNDLKHCENIYNLIEHAIKDEPSQTLKDGDIIREGYNKYVDEFRHIKSNGRQMIASLEALLKRDTGINQLKISYNRVFGYYIEVSKGNLAKVPKTFERKQTLVNAERFVTPELKELENTIMNAEDRLGVLEYDLFCSIRDMIAESADLLRKISKDIAKLDTYLSLARVAVMKGYCKPEINDSGIIDIQEARHPVVEANSKNPFVSNDIFANGSDSRLIIITGPNMSGKSTYIRSVALITIMAHMGSYVPASKATIGVVDRIFTRVGASDNIAKGESTFMVEMMETANILTHATDKSLIILDEIGRGTSTFDGVSIAWAVSEYILNHVKAKTFFATHYHEITDLAQEDNGAKNYTISVKEVDGEIIFMRKIIAGTADRSYGIYVAQLAGLPEKVINRAEEILEDLESGAPAEIKHAYIKPSMDVIVRPMLIFDEEHPVLEKLKTMDINTLTPIDAINALNDLKRLL